MFRKFTGFLAQPYPFYYRSTTLARTSFLILVSIFLFAYLFEPFVVYEPEHRMNYIFICLIHGAIPAILFYVFFYFIQFIPSVEEKWNVLYEITAMFFLLVLIGIGQFLIRDIIYNNPRNWSWRYLLEEIRNTLLVGVLLNFIFVPVNFLRLNRISKNQAAALQEINRPQEHELPSVVPIQTMVKADDFLLDARQLLFIRAEKNYVELYLLNGTTINKTLKRISMKEIESQTAGLRFLMKTHRSYLVNLLAVEQVAGNAQGYRLKLKHCSYPVPVSRNMIPVFEKKRNSL